MSEVSRPEKWEACRFDAVARVISGKNQKEVESPSGEYPIYGSGGAFGHATAYLCEPGTTVIGRKGTINSPIFVNERFWNVDTAFGLCPLNSHALLPRFLYYFCRSFNFAALDKSTTIPSLAKRDIEAITIPLPPLAEQRRIVAKIEELFSELEAGEESLRLARRQLGLYRQSLLKQAFEGHLTAKWRTQNPGKLDSPATLLARIQSARQSRYEQQTADGEINLDGIRLAKTKAPRPIAPFRPDEIATFPPLPASWAREKLGRLFRIVSGYTPKEIRNTAGGMIPYYRVSDMNAPGNGLCMKASSTWLTESQAETLGLHIYPSGTVIFPKRGGAILTNKKRVLSRPSCFDLNTMGVINDEPSIDSDFLRWWFMKLDLGKIYDGSNIPQINNKNVEHLPFELPPLPEQQEIVRLLDEQFEVIERNVREIDGALRKSEALRQAILKKAFTGRLVPQDPADEPASILLARLRAEPTPSLSLSRPGRRKID